MADQGVAENSAQQQSNQHLSKRMGDLDNVMLGLQSRIVHLEDRCVVQKSCNRLLFNA